MEDAPGGLLLLDARGRLTDANAAAERLLDLPHPQSRKGKRDRALLS